MADPNRLTWPPRPSDCLLALASVVAVVGLIEGKLDFVILGLIFAAVAAVIPRMIGHWRVTPRAMEGEFAPPAAFQGEFVEEPAQRAQIRS